MKPALIDTNEEIRVRMAPSPTGALHIGTTRTALFNYLFVRKYGGKFIMRIEDTDHERSKKHWEEDIIEGLRWIGITWDEGPIRQSERGKIYKKYIEEILEQKKAFYCWHTKDELQAEQAQQAEKKEAPRHICEYREEETTDEEKIARSIIRFKNDEIEKVSFHDFIRGDIEFDPSNLGDFSIAKNINTPLYNFAVVIDDYEMKISHVLRGEDHISNTPKQLLLQETLGLPHPKYIHMPLILGADKSKLSKRHGSTSLSEYRDLGYLPEALFNFLSILGWHPSGDDTEIMTKEVIEKKFSVEDMQQSGAIFDIEKLNWMNGEYIRKLPVEDLVELCKPYFSKADFKANEETFKKAVALEKNRIKKISEIIDATEFIFKDITYDTNLLAWKKMHLEDIKKVLSQLLPVLENIDDKKWTKEDLENLIMPLAEQTEDRGSMLWPLRVALTGRKASPGPFEIMEVLGKEKSLDRVKEAVEKLG